VGAFLNDDSRLTQPKFSSGCFPGLTRPIRTDNYRSICARTYTIVVINGQFSSETAFFRSFHLRIFIVFGGTERRVRSNSTVPRTRDTDRTIYISRVLSHIVYGRVFFSFRSTLRNYGHKNDLERPPKRPRDSKTRRGGQTNDSV